MERLTVHTADELVTQWNESARRRRERVTSLGNIYDAQQNAEANIFEQCAAQLGAILDSARAQRDDTIERASDEFHKSGGFR